MGSRTFIFYYLYCGVGAAFWLRVVGLHGRVPFVGASGAVLGVAMAYAMFWPDAELILFPFPIQTCRSRRLAARRIGGAVRRLRHADRGHDRRHRLDRGHRLGARRRRQSTRVRMLREPVAGEGAGARSSSATRCSSTARAPTSRRAIPTLPRNTRAGWGYLMLTNFLPNHGNGTFMLHAYRRRCGRPHDRLLGTKTITCANATRRGRSARSTRRRRGRRSAARATRNFGWVLARAPRARVSAASAPCRCSSTARSCRARRSAG